MALEGATIPAGQTHGLGSALVPAPASPGLEPLTVASRCAAVPETRPAWLRGWDCGHSTRFGPQREEKRQGFAVVCTGESRR